MTEEEKKLVEEVFNNAIDSLSDEDKKLPQVCSLCICVCECARACALTRMHVHGWEFP